MRQLILKWNCRKDLYKPVDMSVLEIDNNGEKCRFINGCEDTDGGEICGKCLCLAQERVQDADYLF